MGTDSTSQFPHTLNRIEFRTICRKKFKTQYLAVFVKKIPQYLGVVVSSIIKYHNDSFPFFSVSKQRYEKRFERHCIKLIFKPRHESSIV